MAESTKSVGGNLVRHHTLFVICTDKYKCSSLYRISLLGGGSVLVEEGDAEGGVPPSVQNTNILSLESECFHQQPFYHGCAPSPLLRPLSTPTIMNCTDIANRGNVLLALPPLTV